MTRARDLASNADGSKPTLVDAKGDLLVGSAADTLVRKAVGTDGQYLQADAASAGGVKWATAAAGGITTITTTNASAATGVSFTSIPATYKHLMLLWTGVYFSATNTAAYIRFNNDSGTNYRYWCTYYNASNTGGVGSTSATVGQTQIGGSTTYNSYCPITNTATALDNTSKTGMLIIYDYTNTNRRYFRYEHGAEAGDGAAGWGQGYYSGGSAVSQLDVIRNSTQTITGTFTLYGIS